MVNKKDLKLQMLYRKYQPTVKLASLTNICLSGIMYSLVYFHSSKEII